MLLSYCGLDCAECGAYLATKNNDNELRKKTAAEWSANYGTDIKPESINCVGCTQEGIKVYHCENLCKVRKCARQKKLSSCAECADFACDNLKQIFSFSKVAKSNLEKLRKK
jgi:hypothetical protein